MTGRMTLGAAVVRPLAAVAGPEVRIGKDRGRWNRQRSHGEGQGQHLSTHGNLLSALIAPTGLPAKTYSEPPLLAELMNVALGQPSMSRVISFGSLNQMTPRRNLIAGHFVDMFWPEAAEMVDRVAPAPRQRARAALLSTADRAPSCRARRAGPALVSEPKRRASQAGGAPKL